MCSRLLPDRQQRLKRFAGGGPVPVGKGLLALRQTRRDNCVDHMIILLSPSQEVESQMLRYCPRNVCDARRHVP